MAYQSGKNFSLVACNTGDSVKVEAMSTPFFVRISWYIYGGQCSTTCKNLNAYAFWPGNSVGLLEICPTETFT